MLYFVIRISYIIKEYNALPVININWCVFFLGFYFTLPNPIIMNQMKNLTNSTPLSLKTMIMILHPLISIIHYLIYFSIILC